MATRVTSLLSRPGLLRALFSHVRVAARLLREPRVPLLTKGILVLAAIYVISPLDFLPDVIPILGQLDDLGIAVLALELFLRLCPAGARVFHLDAIAHGRPYSPMTAVDDVIDVEWRRD